MIVKWTYDRIVEVHKALVHEFTNTNHRIVNGVKNEEILMTCVLKSKKSVPNDILTKRPFKDGNKRTAYVVWRMMVENTTDYEGVIEREKFWLRAMGNGHSKC